MAVGDGETDETKVSRRTWLKATALIPYGIATRERGHRNTVRSTSEVTSEATLADALETDDVVRFNADVTLTETLRTSVNRSDVTIDLNGHTLSKADDMNDSMLVLRTEGDLTIRNGLIDCNRRGQAFPSVKSKEVQLFGGGTCRIVDVTLVDNSDYGLTIENFDQAIAESYVVDSRPHEISQPNDAAGLDGIHTFDCPHVRIMDPEIKSGDDAIAIAANERSVEKAVVRGGSLSSPVHANGIRLHIQSDATADATVSGVEIDTRIHNCRGQGVAIANESRNGNAIRDVTISGTIKNVQDDGVRAFDRVEEVFIDAQIRDSRANGVNIAGGGRKILISATIEHAAVNGIRAVDARDVLVTDSSITACDNWPIISKRNSNWWIILNNEWRDNRFSSISLSNRHNVVALNKVDEYDSPA